MLGNSASRSRSRNFRFDDICYPSGNHRMGGGMVPDMSRLEARMWFYYLCTQYIDAGIEAIHFGQVGLMDKNDPEHAGWLDLLGRVRAYARQHARRHFVICDAHTPTGGYVEDGHLLFDAHAFPLRISEVPDQPPKGSSRSATRTPFSPGARAASPPAAGPANTCPSWSSSTTSAAATRASEQRHVFIWGYDEITWFSVLPEAERNEWLHYAWKWIRDNDPNGHLEMPGSRVISPARHGGGPRWYWANTRSDACPDGSNTEETIKEIWASDSAGQ